MHKASVIGFLVFYMKISLVNSEFEYRVKVMNDMLSYPGWPDLRIPFFDETKIIEDCMGSTEEFRLIDLVTPNDEGWIVTNENVEQKIRHAYQFLSCKFARVLNKICEYNIGICIACRIMENDSKKFDCLKELLEMLKLQYSIIVMLMQGSLSCIHQLSTETHFNKGVFEILENFIQFYKNKFVERDLAPTQKNKTVFPAQATQIATVEEKMSIAVKRLSAFHKSNCRPFWLEETPGTSYTAGIVERVKRRSSPSSMLDEFKGYLESVIKSFLEEFDGKFGFRYDLKSKITSLMYDPDLPLVNILNKLFAKPGWSALGGHVKNIVAEYPVEAVENLLSVSTGGVTKDNVDEKFVQAHNFLSCKYAVTLKRCCDYARLMWKQYYSSTHSSNLIYCYEFLDTIRMSDILVSRMQDGLSHFYKLQPHVELKREAFDILESFKNHLFEMSKNIDIETDMTEMSKNIDIVTDMTEMSKNIDIETDMTEMSKNIDTETDMTEMSENIDIDTDMTEMSKNIDINTDMINILQRLNNFYQPNCSPANTIEADLFLEENPDVKLGSLLYKFKQEIKSILVSDYDDFGFPFDTAPNTSNKRENLGTLEQAP